MLVIRVYSNHSDGMPGLAACLTRGLDAFDAQAGADARAAFGDLAPELAGLIAGAAGCSPYLAELLYKEADWLRDAVACDPTIVIPTLLSGLPAQDRDQLGATLRQAKRRVALYVALADLGGVWPLAELTGALTSFADHAVQAALTSGVAEEIRRGRLPEARPDDAVTGAGMVAIAMGKMGAGELNYSSDIDLICLFDETRYPGAEDEARAAFIRATRRMTSVLSEVTDQGYVFRTDLRLRPDASVTPVCLSMAAAETYYESVGRTWERAAYIKARACAGDIAAGERFLKSLVPFVWRRHLDFAAIQDAHDMRLRIRDHRGLHGIAVEGHDLKLGVGGIREIEFFTQTRQLIAGGRDPDLRDRTTVGGLARLAEKGWVKPDVAETLQQHYLTHRMLEHRLQMVGDAQTHHLPNTPGEVARIAAFMGEGVGRFRQDLILRLHEVDTLTDAFFAPATVAETGADLSDAAKAIVKGWPSYPALRSERAQSSFRRLRPMLLQRLQQAANPDEALVALDGFLGGLPAGVQLFALFEANPTLVDLIVDIAATAPELARYLARNAQVLDAVIGGSFFADWPGKAALCAGAGRALAAADGYESKLVAVRTWQKEWHFRIGVHHLRGLIDANEAAQQYSDLADATVISLFPEVVGDFARRHGPMPGRGAALLGMGSLGAGTLNAGSDLDLILIYDAMGQEASAGAKPLAVRAYFARLTQALVTALTAPMSGGRLYEVDMRLRPSGRQGPVATGWLAFQSYQESEAWTWEHLALTRARVLTGDPGLGDDLEAFRRTLIVRKGQGAEVRADVAAMRSRLRDAHPGQGGFDLKYGAGRLLDIDLAAQMLALMSGSAERATAVQLREAMTLGKVGRHAGDVLLQAHDLFWRVQAALRLMSADPATLGQGAMGLLQRQTGMADKNALIGALNAAAAAAADVIDDLTGQKGLSNETG
jgi:[glutamine synthetase] adenylyltransferase / [glutamine synthetase]-adenylyl-L-tyrosine phosphorylase